MLAVVTREPEVYNGRKISNVTVLLIALYYTASVSRNPSTTRYNTNHNFFIIGDNFFLFPQ
jgi:hypothetical protein